MTLVAELLTALPPLAATLALLLSRRTVAIILFGAIAVLSARDRAARAEAARYVVARLTKNPPTSGRE